MQKEPLCTCFMDTTVHETELCLFWTKQRSVNKTLFPVHNAWIWAEFDDLAASFGFWSSVHTESMLHGVFCFPHVYSEGIRVPKDLD